MEKNCGILSEIFSEFGLKKVSILSTVIDNGSDFVKVYKEFGCIINIQESDEKKKCIYLYFIKISIDINIFVKL